MNTKTLFEKYRMRLTRVGIVKSLMLSLILGFAVTTVLSFITWFIDLPLWAVLLISLGIGAIVIGVTIPILYFKLFSPTTYQIAEKIDRLGLDERLITMYELRKDKSAIAKFQRRDAREKLKTVDEKELKYNISVVVILIVIAAFLLASSMTTVTALAATNYIDHGYDLFAKEEPIIEWCEVDYFAAEHGSIVGESSQLVEKGKDAETVTAVPDEGYAFVQWSDGVISATRWDYNVQSDISVIATFIKVENSGSHDSTPPGDGDDENPDNGGDGEDLPPDEDPPDGDVDNEEDPNDDKNDPENPKNDTPNNPNNPTKEDNNTVIDGETSYSDAFDYEKNKGDLADDDELPDDLKDILGDYLDNLKP